MERPHWKPVLGIQEEGGGEEVEEPVDGEVGDGEGGES